MVHPIPVGTLVRVETVLMNKGGRWEAAGHRRPEQVYWPRGLASLDLMTLVPAHDGGEELYGMVLEHMDASTLGNFCMEDNGGQECYLIYRVLLVADAPILWFPWNRVSSVLDIPQDKR